MTRTPEPERPGGRLARLRGILEMQSAVSELALDPEAATQELLERASELTGADGAAILEITGDELLTRTASGSLAGYLGQRFPLADSATWIALRTGEVAYLPDVREEPRKYGGGGRHGLVSLLAVLLPRPGRPTSLAMASMKPDAFDEEAIETVRLIAQSAGALLRNVEELDARRVLLQQLRESEERFRGAFDTSAVGMSLSGLDGTFVQVNDRFVEMLGYTREEVVGLAPVDITHPDDLAETLRLRAELVRAERKHATIEKRCVRKDGSTFWCLVNLSLVSDFQGQPVNIVAHMLDVDEQKKAVSLFSAIFERSTIPKLILDDKRIVVQANIAAGELFGWERATLEGMRLDELVGERATTRFWDSFSGAGSLEGETQIERPDGTRRYVFYSTVAGVRPGRHLVNLHDVTRQRELEAQLRQAQKMEAVGRLAGGIAHDFNNLLTAIAGYSDFLIAEVDNERLRRHASEIKKASERAASLTGQLLAFSRRQVLQPRVVDLNGIVQGLDGMLRRLIGEDVELVTQRMAETAGVRADPTQIEQVIVNLAVNARDAMPGGGVVTIETEIVETSQGPAVQLLFADTGVGMSEAEQQHLFDPFFTTKAGGTGLGLSTVHGIVQQSGGSIEVESERGTGTTFRIRLPHIEVAGSEPADVPAGATGETGGTETILVVEDESVVRQLVGEILADDGYAVLLAADGPSALELLRRHDGDVHLLLTDVVMPGMSGRDVAEAVGALRPGTPVVYMSGYTDSVIGKHGVLDPGTAFLQKPFGPDELALKIRAVLDKVAALPA